MQYMFAEWVGVEYTVALLTQKNNICRPHLTCTNTRPNVECTGRKYPSTTQIELINYQKGAVHAAFNFTLYVSSEKQQFLGLYLMES